MRETIVHCRGDSDMSDKYTKQILCLANSRKPSGRCVAGKEKSGSWIRPVSTRPGGELSEQERWFENGVDPKVGDIINVPMLGKQKHAFQTENHTIDDGFYWSLHRSATWKEIKDLVDSFSGELWGNDSSSYNGLKDRVSLDVACNIHESLKLIYVTDLLIIVQVEGAAFNNAKRKLRGQFSLNGHLYRLSITDPLIERRYFAGGDGEFPIGAAALCISLGEPYQDFAYKLIAGMILPF